MGDEWTTDDEDEEDEPECEYCFQPAEDCQCSDPDD